MDDDAGVKAPVTRLRRRISIEQSEESKSPAVNTPTKKRGGRRTVKPDLELIDENTPENSTTKKTTKKAAVKDIIDTVEEKAVTPSRRSTRIKSNTSIVSETAIAVDSPRAKRAARRVSQIGSDSEAPPTPIRQTRRTRKDSTSSIEKVEVQPITKPAIQITDVIVEEPETNTRKSTSEANENNTSPSNIRKSPRLQGKIKKNTSINEKEIIIEADPDKSNDNTNDRNSETKDEQSTELQVSQKNRLSMGSSNLIKDLRTEPKTDTKNLNKSTSVLETQKNIKPKRKRTKSWTTVTVSNENNFYSDNEEVKKKIKEGTKVPLVQINKLNSGDSLNTSLNQEKGADISISKKKKKNSNSFVVEDIDKSITNVNNNSFGKNNDENNKSLLIQNNSEKDIVNETSKLFEKEPTSDIHAMIYIEEDSDTNSGKLSIKNRYEHEDQCVPVVQHTSQMEKEISQYSLSSDKITNVGNKSKDAVIMNDSCEPMDVDETVPESLLISEIKANEINSSSSCLQLDKSESKEENNQSKRKSSISHLNKSGNENKSTLILSQLKDTSTADTNNVTKSPKSNFLSKTTDDLNTTQENDVNKRKLSVNYVTTSTPLQQKNLQKLGNINTSIITSNNDAKDIINDNLNQSENKNPVPDYVENEVSKNKFDLNNSESANEKTDKSISENVKHTSKNSSNSTEDSDSEEKPSKNESKNIKSKSFNSINKTKNQSITSDEVDSNHDSESEEESRKISNLIDDEAEDVDDDYESGDSQDENERQYLKDNEILEKGETLTSENDLSNDSDYEKDSFVVSSNEEDNELLEGTEDDLSMSDNELTMTSKSKKKFNERKAKEQKKASREMYESRHKLNISNVSSNSELGKTKKHKRQQISFSESDDEKEVKSKKHNRMRLDSSHEVSLLEDENEKKNSKNKTKRLSESVCDENAMNENEITIHNESLKETDPLSTNVKEEPKTPRKGDSSVAFIDTDNDPNMESELTKTQTEFLDPLQDSIDEDDSLSSDNENIMQNYDSMLEVLNGTNKTKSKTCDISLNIDKKQKKKKNTALVDELNLTQVKSAKKTKNKANKQIQKDSDAFSKNKTMKQDIDDGASSDSIDLHLLFSEDNNSSDNIQNKTNNDNSNTEHFIPLKRTEGKTNIRENADQSISNQTETSFSQNKKKKSRKSDTTSATDNTEENSVSFFIDTEGTLNNSLKKTKNNKKKFSLDNNVANENSDSDAPMDVPFIKEKRTSKIQDDIGDGADETDFPRDTCNKSVSKTPNSDKKKKKKARESQIIEHIENAKIDEESLNMSSSHARKNKSVDEMNEEITEKDITEQAIDKSLIKTPGSHKKKKRKSQSKSHKEDGEEDVPTDIVLNETTGSSKKKKEPSHPQEDNQIEQMEESLNASILKTPGSQKKKKKSIIAQEIEQDDHTSEATLNNSKVKTPSSQKKIKINDLVEQKEIENKTEDLNVTLGSAKKSKKSISSSFTDESTILTTTVELSESNNTSAKKRKRKSSLSTPTEVTVREDEGNTSNTINESVIGSQKKKRKISQNDEIIPIAEPTQEINLKSLNNSKENKLKNDIQNLQNNTEMPKRSKNNKRKQREDDEGHRVSKVAKENSFDKVHVPRLPDTILKQLDDKPRQVPNVKKSKVVSTTQFSVMEAKKRKNKPSNYLEESVYLNDDESTDKKHKKRLQKPKVLPFVPTALTSASGYTTNFKVNVIPTETKFVALSNTASNFKDDYLFNKKIKRQGTYELYKRSRNIKISKF